MSDITGTAKNDILDGTANGDTIQGLGGNDTITGANGDDHLIGGAGNDRLDGGIGADTLEGGAGNDVYVVDNGDTVTENDKEGTDTVRWVGTGDYTLAANVEKLENFGTGGTLHGNALNNVILSIGGSIDGGAGNDTITGGAGHDALDGGEGKDVMSGGLGDDDYVVDDLGDKVIEAAKGGTDTVTALISGTTLAANVENLDLGGTATSGTGNGLDNTINGNIFDDKLDGGAGNDTIFGGFGNDVMLGGSGNDALHGDSGNDTIDGGAGNDSLTGDDGFDHLIGGAGDDRLNGGIGFDQMEGGAGNDTYVVEDPADQVVESKNQGFDTVESGLNSYTLGDNVENLRFVGGGNFTGTGNDLGNQITGGAGDDNLFGGGGNDFLFGSTGLDHMTGGTGNDFYFVQNVNDVLTETAGEGIDTVQLAVASGTYVLADNVENLDISGVQGTEDINAFGNAIDNRITGNDGDNILNGQDGNDSLFGFDGGDTLNGGNGLDKLDGGGGDDALFGDADNDVLSGGDGTDELNGGAGNDTLDGGNGDDELRGDAGIDTLKGGAGNDFYNLGDAGDAADKIVESGNGGHDSVAIAFVTDKAYVLAANVEDFSLFVNATKGLGNALDNEIFGSTKGVAYELDGGAGNDIVHGNDGADLLSGGTGDDDLEGNAGNDVLNGGTGHDVLDGGAGNDTMSGGAGNDIYLVNSADDVVIEAKNQGDDEVFVTTANYTLGDNLEVLLMFGGAVNGTGNALDNVLSGNSAANNLSGLAGNDVLDGGDGDDVADGGIGNDALFGLDGNDKLFGGDGNDTFDIHFLAKGILDVSLSADLDEYHGGKGDDTYLVTSTDDKVFEAVGEGKDLVIADTSYTLAAGQEIESLTLYGTDNFNATGNEFANTITGNSGGNILTGGGGNDTLIGGDGTDTYILNAGDEHDKIVETGKGLGDRVDLHFATPTAYILASGVEDLHLFGPATIGTGNASANFIIGEDNGVSYQLDGGAGNDKVMGAGGDDFLSGGAGDDFLYGLGGVDHMAGGAGNDVYLLDTPADVVTEAKNAGTDTISAGFNFDLALHGENVENLLMTGTGNIEGRGNALNNKIDGNDAGNFITGEDGNDYLLGHGGNDTLNGGNGADRLQGGFGLDTLTGGAGADTFVFTINHPEELPDLGSDVIADFQHGQDKIDVRDLFGVFELSHGGNPITDGHLILTANGDDTIVQFDGDGAGGAAPVTLATVIGVHLTLSDFQH